MAPKDLDLEFEDESEEQDRKKRELDEKKRKETLHHNADLEFSVPGMEGEVSSEGTAAPASRPAASAKPVNAHANAPVVSLEEKKRAQQAAAQPPAKAIPKPMPMPSSQAPQSDQHHHSQPQHGGYSETEMRALIRAAVAECKLEMIAELTSETKELEIKVSRLLNALAAKAPPLKKEFLQIQKMLQDHTKLPLKLVQTEDKKKAA